MGSIFQRYRRTILLSLLLLYALAQIFSAGLRNSHQLNGLERLLINITSPPQQVLTFFIDKLHDVWLGYIYLIDTRKNYRELLDRHQKLVMQNHALREVYEENSRLRNLLGFKEKAELSVVPARVISFGSSSFTHSVRINKGNKDGIEERMPVVTADGVVGHVIQASKHYANVLLLIDPNSNIDVLNQKTRARGLLQGQGTYKLSLQYLTQQESLSRGNDLITSGLDAIYPKGLRVGTVIKRKETAASLFSNVVVEPAANFSRLEEVLVITKAPESTTINDEATLTSEATP